jgi:hypothetical protein
MQNKKKIFPKIKKSLQWFLTDESWKISKKDALWISAWIAMLNIVDPDIVQAWHSSSWWTHSNSTSCSGHASQGSFSAYSSGSHQSGTPAGSHSSHTKAGHWSVSWWNPNGHFSRSATLPSAWHGSWYSYGWGHTSGTSRGWHVSQAAFSAAAHNSHTNNTVPHSSHGSHGSHCSSMC